MAFNNQAPATNARGMRSCSLCTSPQEEGRCSSSAQEASQALVRRRHTQQKVHLPFLPAATAVIFAGASITWSRRWRRVLKTSVLTRSFFAAKQLREVTALMSRVHVTPDELATFEKRLQGVLKHHGLVLRPCQTDNVDHRTRCPCPHTAGLR